VPKYLGEKIPKRKIAWNGQEAMFFPGQNMQLVEHLAYSILEYLIIDDKGNGKPITNHVV
jgi:hypothetical protein